MFRSLEVATAGSLDSTIELDIILLLTELLDSNISEPVELTEGRTSELELGSSGMLVEGMDDCVPSEDDNASSDDDIKISADVDESTDVI